MTGLLAGGWQWSLLLPQITAPRPPREKIRVSDEALTVARIRAIPMTPPALPEHRPAFAPDAAGPSIPEQAGPARRTVNHRCPGWPGRPTACGSLVGAEGILCPACLAHRIDATTTRPCATDGCDGATRTDSGRDLCPACTSEAAAADVPRCSTDGCHRSAVLHGQCVQCRREQREHADAEAAFAELLASGPPTPAPF